MRATSVIDVNYVLLSALPAVLRGLPAVNIVACTPSTKGVCATLTADIDHTVVDMLPALHPLFSALEIVSRPLGERDMRATPPTHIHHAWTSLCSLQNAPVFRPS